MKRVAAIAPGNHKAALIHLDEQVCVWGVCVRRVRRQESLSCNSLGCLYVANCLFSELLNSEKLSPPNQRAAGSRKKKEEEQEEQE